MNHAEVCPEDIALIDAGSGRSVSYGELKARATAVAAGISEKDIKGVPVALTLPRGIEQIEAALGILLSGNSYLPSQGFPYLPASPVFRIIPDS